MKSKGDRKNIAMSVNELKQIKAAIDENKLLRETLKEIVEGLSTKLPIAKKITQYDSSTKEDWLIEVPDQYEYSAFFEWVDSNLGKWKALTVER